MPAVERQCMVDALADWIDAVNEANNVEDKDK